MISVEVSGYVLFVLLNSSRAGGQVWDGVSWGSSKNHNHFLLSAFNQYLHLLILQRVLYKVSSWEEEGRIDFESFANCLHSGSCWTCSESSFTCHSRDLVENKLLPPWGIELEFAQNFLSVSLPLPFQFFFFFCNNFVSPYCKAQEFNPQLCTIESLNL